MGNDAALGSLYPGLRDTSGATTDIDAELLHSTAQKAHDSRATNERFFATQAQVIIAAAHAVAKTYREGGRLFSMGNGGSSCDAAHVAVEFVHPITTGRPALAAVNLVSDLAMLTAVGNDVGFDHIFARQLTAHGRAGDALIGFSTSGNSTNLLAAYAEAKRMGIATIGFAGGDGGRMAAPGVIEHCLVVPTTSIHRVQECHVTAYHILWDLVHTLLAQQGRS